MSGCALTLKDIASLREQAGDVAGALRIYQESLGLFESLGDVMSRAVTLGNIANLREQAGDMAGALEFYEESLGLLEPLGDMSDGRVARLGRARVLRAQKRFDKALAAYESILTDFPADEAALSGRAELLKVQSQETLVSDTKSRPLTASEKAREVFISYARGDESPEGKKREKAIEQLYTALERDGFHPVRDRDQTLPGERISAAIRRLTSSDFVVVVISDKYLRSPYCMYELYRLWQIYQGRGDLAQSLVPIVLQEVKISNFQDRAPYLKYWDVQAKSLEKLARDPDLLLDSLSREELRRVREFTYHVDDILGFLQDLIIPRKLEVDLDDGFQSVRDALRRRMGVDG
jgi:internalin A